MPEKNHNCIMCDNSYYYCETCNKINSWRTICDTARHYQLYMIIKDYRDNYISIDEAAEYIGIKTVTLRNWIKKKPDIGSQQSMTLRIRRIHVL